MLVHCDGCGILLGEENDALDPTSYNFCSVECAEDVGTRDGLAAMLNENECDTLATPADAMREHAQNVGRDHPDVAWISTPYDVWMPNPFYTGAPQPHPESDEARLSAEEWEEVEKERHEHHWTRGHEPQSDCIECGELLAPDPHVDDDLPF